MSLQAAPITRLGVVPPGPDPYKLVKDDIELIKSSIKKMLSTNKGTGASLAQNDVLTMGEDASGGKMQDLYLNIPE